MSHSISNIKTFVKNKLHGQMFCQRSTLILSILQLTLKHFNTVHPYNKTIVSEVLYSSVKLHIIMHKNKRVTQISLFFKTDVT